METVLPLLTLKFLCTWILPLYFVSCCAFNVEEEVVVTRNGWTPKKRRKYIHIYIDVASNSASSKLRSQENTKHSYQVRKYSGYEQLFHENYVLIIVIFIAKRNRDKVNIMR